MDVLIVEFELSQGAALAKNAVCLYAPEMQC